MSEAVKTLSRSLWAAHSVSCSHQHARSLVQLHIIAAAEESTGLNHSQAFGQNRKCVVEDSQTADLVMSYLGDSPPWEQFVGEVRGLVLLGVWRCGVRPMVLLGDPWKTRKTMRWPRWGMELVTRWGLCLKPMTRLDRSTIEESQLCFFSFPITSSQ